MPLASPPELGRVRRGWVLRRSVQSHTSACSPNFADGGNTDLIVLKSASKFIYRSSRFALCRNAIQRSIEHFIQAVDSYIRWYNEQRIEISPRSLNPIKY